MANPIKYTKVLEAAGFTRNQAEAQVEIVIDAVGDKLNYLATKEDMQVLRSEVKADLVLMRAELAAIKNDVDHKIKDSELRLTMRLGTITVSTVTICTAILAFIIKFK